MSLRSYRNNHKRCRFCVYAEVDHTYMPSHIQIDNKTCWCKVKRKRTRLNVPRWFCDGYLPDSEIVINYKQNSEIIK